MSTRPVLEPGPDHPIEVRPSGSHVTVSCGGRAVAASDRAMLLEEAGYPPVAYLPLSDVDPTLLEASSHTTYCPYKGEASYFHLVLGQERLDDAVWSYRDPYPAVAGIADHVAFYPDKVQVELG